MENSDAGTIAVFGQKENARLLPKSRENKILMSPAKELISICNMIQQLELVFHWAAYIELDDAYNWDPVLM